MEHENTISHVKYLIIKLAIYVILAVFVFIFREHLTTEQSLKYFIGSLMILMVLKKHYLKSSIMALASGDKKKSI